MHRMIVDDGANAGAVMLIVDLHTGIIILFVCVCMCVCVLVCRVHTG